MDENIDAKPFYTTQLCADFVSAVPKLLTARSINVYTKEFYRLNARNNLNESESQVVARSVNGLSTAIQDQLALKHIRRMATAVELANKVEAQLHRTARAGGSSSCSSGFEGVYDKCPIAPTIVPRPPQPVSNKIDPAPTAPIPLAQTRPNPYAYPLPGKCFRCQQPGHHSNE